MTLLDINGIEVRLFATDPVTGCTLFDGVTGEPIYDDDVEGVACEMERRRAR